MGLQKNNVVCIVIGVSGSKGWLSRKNFSFKFVESEI